MQSAVESFPETSDRIVGTTPILDDLQSFLFSECNTHSFCEGLDCTRTCTVTTAQLTYLPELTLLLTNVVVVHSELLSSKDLVDVLPFVVRLQLPLFSGQPS